MVESCIRFISRHGEKILRWSDRFRISFFLSADWLNYYKCNWFWISLNCKKCIRILPSNFRFVNLWNWTRELILTCVWLCICVGLQHEGIFRVSGSQVEVNDIKNAFERGNTVLQEKQAFPFCCVYRARYYLLCPTVSPLLIRFRWGPARRGPKWPWHGLNCWCAQALL